MSFLPVAALLAPLVTGFACMILWSRPSLQKWVSLVGGGALAAVGVAAVAATRDGAILVHQPGGWPAPFGISLVIDLASAIMLLGTGAVALANGFYCLEGVTTERRRFGFFPLTNFLLFGVAGAFVAGDLFNLYVWFEVLLMASFGLMTLGGSNRQLRAGFAYVLLNVLASVFFLIGLGLLYGLAGTLNMADLAAKFSSDEARAGLLPAIAFLFAGFAVKAGVFPLFAWLPLSYHAPLPSVSAVFGGLLTKVGVYALLRLFTTVYPIEGSFFQPLLVAISVFTMLVGVLAAAAQYEMRRILSVHIVSQVGYMTLAVALSSRIGIAAAVFFIAHQMIVKTNLFYVAGAIEGLRGTGDVRKLGGLSDAKPALAALFLVSAMALAGLPPLSGFAAKLLVLRAGLSAGEGIAVACALVTSLFTLYSMMKIWAGAFLGAPSMKTGTHDRKPIGPGMWAGMALLAVLAIGMGVWGAGPVRWSFVAADSMLDRAGYSNRVMKEAR